MKVWTKVKLTDKNKDVELIAKSLTNYLYGYGPILNITRKYHIKPEDRKVLDQYTANRIAGILLSLIHICGQRWQCRSKKN